jgi:hypothetical protein
MGKIKVEYKSMDTFSNKIPFIEIKKKKIKLIIE